MAIDNPCRLTARALASKLRRRELTAVEALEAHLERVERENPLLNAVISVDADGARRAARAADARLAQLGRKREGGGDDEGDDESDGLGPLHGVPLTLKDAHEVAGLRTTVGLAPFDHVAATDGTVAARLRAAGAILFGHTNVAAALADPLQTENPLFGRTANPWDTERTPGGSSGGAAVAVAAGLTPLEVGSDLAGSIRLPAAFCGIYGLKTTEHRIPFTGFFVQPGGAPRSVRIMSCLGPMARDLGDLELALGLLSGPDGHDGDVPPVPLTPERRPRGQRPLRELRLCVVPALPGGAVSAAVGRRIQTLADQAAQAGARVQSRLPDTDWKGFFGLFGDLAGTITSLFDPSAKLGDEQRSLAHYLEALERRDRFAQAWHAFFSQIDALILPAAPTAAFTQRKSGEPIDVDGKPVDYWQYGSGAVLCNLTGLPALAAPAGLDQDGLPIGIQIVGPLWSEARLIRIARELEQTDILPGFQAPPSSRARAHPSTRGSRGERWHDDGARP